MATTILYDQLLGDASKSIDVLSTSTVGYPTSDVYNVFGPVYLPRIYGKDLSSFEIASSGKVAVTLKDTHAFDLEYNPTTTTSSIAAVNGESFKLIADGGSTSMLMDTITKDLSLTTPSNIVFNSASVIFNATGAAASLTGSDYTVQVSGATYLRSTSNIELTSSEGSAILASADSNVYVHLNHTTSNLETYALNNVLVSASNALRAEAKTDATFNALTGALVLTAGSSNAQVTLGTSGARIYAQSNISFTTSNALELFSTKQASLATGSNIVLSGASGASMLTLSSTAINGTASNFIYDALDSQGYTFKVGSSDIMKVTSNKVILNTDLDVYGVVNSIAVENTELHIADKTVKLAYPATGETMTDGPATNSDSGVVVSGLPASAAGMSPADAQKLYEKSFKWNYGTSGVDGMLTNSGISTESFWELKGGRLQMTSTKANGKSITFALRINELDELEFVKMWDDSTNQRQVRRIAKFGRTIL
jgi:hypothetical protein